MTHIAARIALGAVAGVLLLGACGGGGDGGSQPPRPDVALLNAGVLGGDASSVDLVTNLVASGRFNSVTRLDVGPGASSPTVADLRTFAAVMVAVDATFADNVSFGNMLADYVDTGGGVVLTVFAYNTGASGINGRFRTDDYFAIPGQVSSQSNTGTYGLGVVYDASHPVLAGVATFSGGTLSARPNTMSVTPAAVRIADWNDGGTPLVAVRVIGSARRVDLGFFPPSSDVSSNFWDVTTDGARLLANALAWAAGP